MVIGAIFGSAVTSMSSPSPSPPTPSQPLAPPLPPDTVCGTSGASASGPALCMVGQSLGTAGMPWIVQGHGFAPGTPVTVSLTWHSPPQIEANGTFVHTAAVKPVVARDGSLRLDINRLFPGSLRLGMFEVNVTGAHGAKASTQFIVLPPGS
jgi:hypothetical protein